MRSTQYLIVNNITGYYIAEGRAGDGSRVETVFIEHAHRCKDKEHAERVLKVYIDEHWIASINSYDIVEEQILYI